MNDDIRFIARHRVAAAIVEVRPHGRTGTVPPRPVRRAA